jgi:hypothetical protein
MSVNCRFTLDENCKVIDAVNVANSGKAYYHEGDPEDDKHLREGVLMNRLSGLVGKLIILRPRQKLPSGDEYGPYNEESYSVWMALFYTIRASYLNTFDPALSIEHRFGGRLKRQNTPTQDFTSLALFRDDVECLLRDLYGDVESEALHSIVEAVFLIAKKFTKYVCPDLCNEHEDAEDLDWMFGIGLPDGCGISGSDHAQGMVAKRDLILRAYEVQQEPSAFSDYTIDFANRFSQQWDCSLNSVRSLVLCDLESDPHLRDHLQRSPALSRIFSNGII